jgi:hypothetical protein
MEYAIGAGAGLVLGLILAAVYAMSKAGGFPEVTRGLALAGKAREDKAFSEKLKAILAGADIKPIEPPRPPKPSGAALRMLAILQAEARLVDFLLEDIQGASDQQIGQAVREVHKKAQAALKQHAVIETVLTGTEGDTTTVARGFDPAAIRVVGNVTGEPPFTGQIQHPGWRVKELKIAAPPEGADEFVLQPAEVQIA